jgi:hypothetical protein
VDVMLDDNFNLCDEKGNHYDLPATTLRIEIKKKIPIKLIDQYKTIKKFTELSNDSWVG